MPLTNFGILPAGAVATELVAVTRRAVIPAVVVQFGSNSVTLSSLLSHAEPVEGGVSPVTAPVQGTGMTTFQYVDYSGSFSGPAVQSGLTNAEYNLAAGLVGIPYYLFEGLVQQGADLVPLIWARVNDAGNQAAITMAQKLWAAISTNTTLMPFSLNDVFATTNPTQGNLGNIDATANAWWQANVAAMSAINTASSAWSRVNALAILTYAQSKSGGEAPSCLLVAPGAWMALASDAIGAERYVVAHEGTYAEAAEGATVAFPAINIAGIPVYADLYQTDGTVALAPNWNYLGFKVHADATFAVAGPESLLPQFQLGYIMAMLIVYTLVCTKRSAQTKITGLTGAFSI